MIAVAVAALLAFPPAPPIRGGDPTSASSVGSPTMAVFGAPAPHAGAVPVNLSDSGAPFDLPADFWGSTVPVDSSVVANESEFINASPARMLVWPGGGFGDRYDPIARTLYGDGGVGAAAASNATEFIELCREVGCQAIFQVPGEINSSTFAARCVTYIEQTLGFHPLYWEIGNEPALWDHFGLPWASWNATQEQAPTPQQYAQLVFRYAEAMRAVDPSIRILGLPGSGARGSAEAPWVSAVGAVDGAFISGLAIHAYPAGIGPAHPSLSGFLSSVSDSSSLTSRLPLDRATLAAACRSCPALPWFVTELGSAVLSGTYDPYVEGVPDAVYLGSEVVQALASNITNLDTFGVRFTNPGSWENTTSVVHPSYTLFSGLLSRLGGRVQLLGVSGGVGGVYAVETVRSGTAPATDLFVVNANTSAAIQVATTALGNLASGPLETWNWNVSTAEPVASFWPQGLSRGVTVPPVSLLLVEASTPASVPLRVTESGLPNGARWYLSVDHRTETTATNELTFLLSPGRYGVEMGPPELLPDGGRRVGFAPTNISIATSPATLSVGFGEQFLLLLATSPAGTGDVLPHSGWYNASGPVSLVAMPRPGYTFVGWSDNGTGGYSGSAAHSSVSLKGRTTEVATFAPLADPPNSVGGPALLHSLPAGSTLPIAAGLIGAACLINFHRRRLTPPPGAAARAKP